MNSAQRREKLLNMLWEESRPLSATAIAKEFGVSRQIIVGDVALLRAAGENIAATRGDMCYRKNAAATPKRLLAATMTTTSSRSFIL